MAYNSETDKIDKLATDGLAGTSNSLAYRVMEIEKHLHSSGSWFGLAGTPTATYKACRIGESDCSGPFQMDGGDSSVTPTWGAWIQVFGADDTPARTSQAYFDPHEIVITSTAGS